MEPPVVNLLEILDLPDAGQLQLSRLAGAARQTAPPAAFQNPLDAADQAEIAWYFQEYPDNPLGMAKERAAAVATGLRNLGRLLFETVFNSSDHARQILTATTADGVSHCQLSILSSRPDFLSLPWELLNSPETGYLASALSSIARQTAAAPLPDYSPALPADQLNILLVSPQPETGADTPPTSLSAATLSILESLPVQVELDYLRPPTFAALSRQLSDRTAHYHLLQLDALQLDPDTGHLLFANPDGSSDPIAAPQLADLLNAAQVPVLLLTAGSRAPAHPSTANLWAKLAYELSRGGVPASVLLPWPLTTAAGSNFLRPFYQTLADGNEIAAAVAQGRAALLNQPQRPALGGPRLSWDWTTPLVYPACQFTPPAIAREQPNPLAAPVIQPPQPDTAGAESQFPAAGQYGLIGRQTELRRLERLILSHPLTLLSGNAGVGKTELVLDLARWLQKTATPQLPGGVFYTVFEPAHPAALERVIHEIGTAIAGLPFADLPPQQQPQWVLEYLQEHPSLLIWDGVENIAGFPPGSPGLLTESEHSELDAFLTAATANSASRALLSSRNPAESWLSPPAAAYTLTGLNPLDRRDLAQAILAKAAVPPDRVNPQLLDLLDILAGHPLACQIALPLLKEVPASILLSELQRGLADFPESAAAPGRDNFLTALMEYAWTKMSHRSRTHLPFLALFQRRVMLDILTHITQEPPYRAALGEELGWGACRTLLRSALAAGFLEPVSPSVYQIPPALPWFYGRKLARQLSPAAISRLEAEFVRVYADTADYFMESLYENQDAGATAILAEQGNLHQALALALESRQWDNAQLLVQPLAQVYRMQKRIPELRRLRAQLLESAGPTAAAATAAGAIDLWLYLLGTDVSESVESGDLSRAEQLNQQLSDYLTAQPDAATDPRAASVYHQFGAIALARRQLDPAADWFHRSLAIIENGDDRAAVADDYFALGQLRQLQRLYTEAKDWYGKALEIHQRLPDPEEMVKDYRALGLISQLKFEHKEAESWYHRARSIVEENRDEETAVLIFHELGTVCHAQYLFDEAQNWYQQALSLSDRQGNQPQVATELHHLGLLAQDRGIIYQEAEEWYLAALDRRETIGDRRGVGDECRQLGVLFHEQQQYATAENWYHQAREIFEQLGDVHRLARTYGQLGMIAEEQENLAAALEWVARTWQLVADYNLPVVVQVKAHLARLRDKYGGPEPFNHWWQDFTGQPPPDDLDVDASGIL